MARDVLSVVVGTQVVCCSVVILSKPWRCGSMVLDNLSGKKLEKICHLTAMSNLRHCLTPSYVSTQDSSLLGCYSVSFILINGSSFRYGVKSFNNSECSQIC
jgi:hypothetical protein